MTAKDNAPELVEKFCVGAGIRIQPWQRDMLDRTFGNPARGMASAYVLTKNGDLLDRVKRDLAEVERDRITVIRAEHAREIRATRLAFSGLGFCVGAILFTILNVVVSHA